MQLAGHTCGTHLTFYGIYHWGDVLASPPGSFFFVNGGTTNFTGGFMPPPSPPYFAPRTRLISSFTIYSVDIFFLVIFSIAKNDKWFLNKKNTINFGPNYNPSNNTNFTYTPSESKTSGVLSNNS